MQSLKFGFLVIARIVDGDILKGFHVVSTTGETFKVTLDMVAKTGFKYPYKNAEFDAQYNTLVGKNSNVLAKYPSINSNMARTSKEGITILATVLDRDTKKPIGVVAYNSLGGKFVLSYKKLSELARKYINCNFELVNDKNYGYIAVQKDGSYFETVEMSSPKKEQNNVPVSPVSIQSTEDLPTVEVYSMDFLKDNEFSQPCQEKLVETMLNMQKLTPYYYTILQAIRRLPLPNYGTMGVTEDTLYYDLEFVSKLRVPVLTFVLIHEILHLAMQHPVRIGNRKNPKLWNVATDLYINTIICNDFGCKFGGGVVNVGTKERPIEIKAPDFGIFIETIGESIDLAIDTPETIYARLLNENQGDNSSQSQSSSGGDSGQSSEDSLSQGCDNISKGADKIKEQVNKTGTPEQRNQAQKAKKDLDKALEKLQESCSNNDKEKRDEAIDDVDDAMSELLDALEKSESDKQDGQQGNEQGGQQGNEQDGQQGNEQGGQRGNEQGGQRGNEQGGSSNSGQQGGSSGSQQGQGGSSGSQQGLGGSSGSQQGQGGSNLGQQGGSSLGEAGKTQMEVGEQQVADALTGNSQGQSQPGFDSSGSSSQSTEGDLAENANDIDSIKDGMQDIEVTYNGKKLKGTIMKDVMTSKQPKNEEDVTENIERSKQALQRISTKIKIEEENLGEPLAKNAGSGCDLVGRYIEFGLSSGVDWRVLLKNMCKDKPKKTFTLAQPNEAYMNMGVTIADRRSIGKPTHIAHVKWAVDVSGSVSEKELNIILSEISNIFRHFKVDGELIYWSTMVGDAGAFSSLKDMLKVKPVSSLGTDVRCVFEYLSGETKVNRKSEPDKIKDIKAVFILTDGYFSNNYAKYQRAFGRKVIWLITGSRGNPITFNPPFGKVIGLDLD